jgi:hypothetical protein
MVLGSWLEPRNLQQWEHEAKTIQGVRQRRSDIHHYYPHQARQAAGEEERPHLQTLQALEVPQAVGDGAGELFRRRALQQWEQEVKTMQRVGGKDGVIFTTLHHHQARRTLREQERKRGHTYRPCRLFRFPRLSGMVPVSWLEPRTLQQWEHEAKTIQGVRPDGVIFTTITLIKHDRQHERKRGHINYRAVRLVRFPRLAGMVPVRPLPRSCLH